MSRGRQLGREMGSFVRGRSRSMGQSVKKIIRFCSLCVCVEAIAMTDK